LNRGRRKEKGRKKRREGLSRQGSEERGKREIAYASLFCIE